MSMGIDPRTIEDMMRMLANGPDEIRRTTMKTRMDELMYMDENQRQQNIYMAVSAMHRLSYPETRLLVKTGIEILAGYPEYWRRTFMMSRMGALMNDPALSQRDMQIGQEVLMELPEYLRTPFMHTMQQVMQSMSQTDMIGQQSYGPQPEYGQYPQPSSYGPKYQYPQQYQRQYFQSGQQQYAQAQQPQQYQYSSQQQTSQTQCPNCGHELQWVPQYQKYYCYNEQRYL